VTDPLDLEALEASARERLEPGVYDYIAGGADAELTMADNLAAWSRLRLRLRPRVLRDVAAVSTAITVLGVETPTPTCSPSPDPAPWVAVPLSHPRVSLTPVISVCWCSTPGGPCVSTVAR
jgi:4-hydroxymandelate oxidase